MNNGAFGENFPYVNFHDLNLDWIIKICKELKDEYAEVKVIADQADEILQKLEELDNLEEEFEQLKADVTELINTVDEIVNTLYRPLTSVICLTDSYGSNDPDANRYSWCDHLKDLKGLASDKYTKIYMPGASFGDDDANKNLYNIFVNGTLNMTADRKNETSDIIIVSGINEWNESDALMETNIRNLNTYIRNNFPNAEIWLFCVEWDKRANIRFITMGRNPNTYDIYRRLATELAWHCVINISAMVNKQVYVDDVHPNTSGSRQIAEIIINAITNSNIDYNTNMLIPVTITTSSTTRNAGAIYYDGNNFIWSTSAFSCDALPDIPAGFDGAIKLGTLNTNLIIGTDYENNPAPTNIKAELGIRTNGTWSVIRGTLSIRFIDNNPELWFRNNSEFSSIPTQAHTGITDSYVSIGTSIIPAWD